MGMFLFLNINKVWAHSPVNEKTATTCSSSRVGDIVFCTSKVTKLASIPCSKQTKSLQNLPAKCWISASWCEPPRE